MVSSRIPGVPSVGDMMRLMQAQSEVVATLPETVRELNRAALSLAEVVETTRESMLAVQQVAARINKVIDEIEEPVHGLQPGLVRLADVLADPVIERIPETLTRVEGAVNSVAGSVQRTRFRLSQIRHAPDRWSRHRER